MGLEMRASGGRLTYVRQTGRIDEREPMTDNSDIYDLTRCGTARAPEGWACTRVADHEGPCAGVPTLDLDWWETKPRRGRSPFWDGVVLGATIGAVTVVITIAAALIR